MTGGMGWIDKENSKWGIESHLPTFPELASANEGEGEGRGDATPAFIGANEGWGDAAISVDLHDRR